MGYIELLKIINIKGVFFNVVFSGKWNFWWYLLSFREEKICCLRLIILEKFWIIRE